MHDASAPYVLVAMQECERMNRLLQVCVRSRVVSLLAYVHILGFRWGRGMPLNFTLVLVFCPQYFTTWSRCLIAGDASLADRAAQGLGRPAEHV